MKIGNEIVDPVKQAWHRFIERTEPVRPELSRFCRSLTGSVWEGEDLVQDTLMRGFARLSETSRPIENARAYLFKIASNLWTDRFRTRHEFPSADIPESPQPEVPFSREILDAARHLFAHVPPVERAAVLLKDVFDLSLDETASALETTVGAVKSALHRGRAKLNEMQHEPAPAAGSNFRPPSATLEKFVDAFNARDLNRLIAMMREDVTSEMVGMFIEEGRDAVGKSDRSILHHTFASSDRWRAEARSHEGEQIALLWAEFEGNEALASIARLEELDGAISRVRYYFFCPETLSELGRELGLPVRTNGYRPSWE